MHNAGLYPLLASMPESEEPKDRMSYPPGPLPTITQIAMLLNQGKALNIVADEHGRPKWTDPLTGQAYFIQIREDGRIRTWSTAPGGWPPACPPMPGTPPLLAATKQAQRELLPASTLIWPCLLLLYLVWRSARERPAEMMLALALVAIVANAMLISLYFRQHLDTYLKEQFELGAITGFLLLVSGVLLLVARKWALKPLAPGLSCEACGYNLTGNNSGICPECGNPIADSSAPTG